MQPPADLNAALRRLPKVDEVLATPVAQELLQRAPRWAVVAAIRAEIDRLRQQVREGAVPDAADARALALDGKSLQAEVAQLMRPSLQPLLNATGVVLHTNLGRAPIAETGMDGALVSRTPDRRASAPRPPRAGRGGESDDFGDGLLPLSRSAHAADCDWVCVRNRCCNF